MGNTRNSGPDIAQSSSLKQKQNLKQHPTSHFNEHSFPILLFILFLHFVLLLPYRHTWDQFCPSKASWADREGNHNLLHVCYKHPITPAADNSEGHPGSGRRVLCMRDVLHGGSANSPAAATAPFLLFFLSLCWARASLSLSRGQNQDQRGLADLHNAHRKDDRWI